MFAILIVFASFQPIIEDINSGKILSKKDQKKIAKDWIENNLSNGSKIAYEHYAPQLHINPHNNFTLMNVGWEMIVSKPLSYYKNNSIDYIIITNSFKKRHYNEPNKYVNAIHAAAKSLHVIYEDLYYSLSLTKDTEVKKSIYLHEFLRDRITFFSLLAEIKGMEFIMNVDLEIS